MAVLLGLTITWGVLTFGAVYEWAYRPLLVLTALTGVTAWLRPSGRWVPWLVVSAAVLTAIAVVGQLVPIDATTLRRISPGTDRLLRSNQLAYATAAASGAPISHPFSVSPALTLVGFTFLACASALIVGVARWLTRQRLRNLAMFLAALGALISIEAIIQRVTSPELIYGFWQPKQLAFPFGPFVNKNHFAGWILMALPVTLGLAIGLIVRGQQRPAHDWRDRVVKLSEAEGPIVMLVAFSGFAMIVALLFSLSRSGIASAVVAFLIAALVTRRQLTGLSRLSLSAVLVLIALAVAWVGLDMVGERFAALDAITYEARQGMWRDTLRMAADVPLVGVGIRAFTVANLFYQTNLLQYHVGAAHSDWLQLVAEGGVLVSIPAGFGLMTLTWESRKRFLEHRQAHAFGLTYWTRVGAGTGILAICLQSLVEFSLQMPGNTVTFALLWAIAIAPAPADVRLRHSRRLVQERV